MGDAERKSESSQVQQKGWERIWRTKPFEEAHLKRVKWAFLLHTSWPLAVIGAIVGGARRGR